MRTPTLAGQYRRYQHTSDGCAIYICNWCERSVEVRGDPISGWCFCPKCGKSWFTRQECRDHDTPRWVWNLVKSNHYDYCVPYPKTRYKWVAMERTKWGSDQWGEWKFEAEYPVDHGKLGAWRDAKYFIEMARSRIAPNRGGLLDIIQFEYKIGVERV